MIKITKAICKAQGMGRKLLLSFDFRNHQKLVCHENSVDFKS